MITCAFCTSGAEALARWQILAENPLASREAVTGARVLMRTAEGLLAACSALETSENSI